MYMRLLFLGFLASRHLCAAGSLGANRELHSACKVKNERDKRCSATKYHTTICSKDGHPYNCPTSIPLGAFKRCFTTQSPWAVPNKISQTCTVRRKSGIEHIHF